MLNTGSKEELSMNNWLKIIFSFSENKLISSINFELDDIILYAFVNLETLQSY